MRQVQFLDAWHQYWKLCKMYFFNKKNLPFFLGWLTHICVSKLTIIGSDNGLSPGRSQAIIWINAGILLIWAVGTNFSETLSEIHTFSFKKMLSKISSGNHLVLASMCSYVCYDAYYVVTKRTNHHSYDLTHWGRDKLPPFQRRHLYQWKSRTLESSSTVLYLHKANVSRTN